MSAYKINVLLRTDKVNSRGERPIIITLSVANQLKKINTSFSVFPEQWDKAKKQVVYLNKANASKLLPLVDSDTLPLKQEVNCINGDLLKIKNDINDIIKLKIIQGIEFSSEDIVDEYKNKRGGKLAKKEEATNLLFEYIDKYIFENSLSRVKGSLSVYKSLKTHLQSYQNERKVKVKFSEMTHDFVQDFQNFLFTHTTQKGKTLNNITIAKQITTLKTFLGYAKKSGIDVHDGYKDFIVKRQKLEVIALTEEEFYKIYNLDLSGNDRLDRVRDVFIMSIMIGYRYSDLKQLKRYHIKNNDTIILTTQKTVKPIVTPLNAIAKQIINKYQNDEKPIPVISNQKYNKYLTELCKMAEINDEVEIIRFKGAERIVSVYPKWELITAHTGRKSFATLLLAKGVAPQIIMELGGWSDLKSFMRYIKVNEDTMRSAVTNAWGD
ncbi:hypothetical protein CHU00_17660 [Sphingobacterium cellulitidis]|uniref:site-specific integrase n=1 Tax=Sphingobacterium cellulitidis TaxID=1768011 RepID=UPI000B93F0BA|nr:site-specific integrase [Sphingobacterium cellulitidis]OYD44268.1 hypothetical protein CHU00_17660 [Sphingobacterium cellulitidis]